MLQANISVVPIRAEASDKAEMVSQLLYGEEYEVLESQEKWLKIKAAFDGYIGWIDKKQSSTDTFDNTSFVVSKYALVNVGVQKHLLSIGARLPLHYEQIDSIGEVSTQEQDIISTAKLFLETPYLWGGKSVFGIDCSGFTQQVFKLAGFKLPRDAYQQAEIGEKVAFGEHQANDLAFFASNDRITHVGILTDKDHIIHASGKVRIDQFNDKGIIQEESKELTHHLIAIKRIR